MIADQWTSWVAHFLQGVVYAYLVAAWLDPAAGYVTNAAIWTHREASDLLDHYRAGDMVEYRADGWIDWMAGMIGGGVGVLIAVVV